MVEMRLKSTPDESHSIFKQLTSSFLFNNYCLPFKVYKTGKL